jgi:hypothetical protein
MIFRAQCKSSMPKAQSQSAIADISARSEWIILRSAAPALILIAVLLALQLLTIATGLSPVREELLIDTDSYMKLVRIERLLATGNWHDGSITRSNSPDGETLHWTRLFDVFVILLAGPLLPFMDLRSALFWSGAAVSPLLLLMTAGAMIWAARPLLSQNALGGRALVALLTLIQPAVFTYAVPGRADHHVLLMLIFVLLFGAMLRALRVGEAGARKLLLRYGALAGGLAGVGIWASVELLVGAAACSAALGFAWLVRGGLWLRGNVAFAAAFFGAVAVSLVIERPVADIFKVEGDRISILHLILSGGLFSLWLCIALGVGDRVQRLPARIAIAASGALSMSVALALVFPQLLAGPLSQVDPRILKIWMERVNEMRPLWPTLLGDTPKLVERLSLGIAGLPFLIWSLIALRRHPAWLCYVCLAFGVAATVPIALAYKRFAPYSELLFGLVLYELLRRLFTSAEGLPGPVMRGLARGGAAGLLFLAPLMIAAPFQNRPAAATNESVRDCAVKGIAAFLADPRAEFGQRPLTILTSIDLGPELLYRTPHRVIGTPYHRNANGIYDTYRALSGSAETARQTVLDRRIELVLLCRARGERGPYSGAAGGESFYEQLERGQLPVWLAPIALPGDLAERFKLFRALPVSTR